MVYKEKTASPSNADQNTRQEVRREIYELVKMVGIFLVLFWGLKTFVIEGYEVQGPSMDPTLHDRERILVFKLPYTLPELPFVGKVNTIDPGDIVVFESGEESNKSYIKRVIAEGPPLPAGNFAVAGAEGHHAEVEPVTVKYTKGTVYVDNHKLEETYLTAEERHSPEDDEVVFLGEGQYYVLGDHRSVSKDSRSFGAIDEEQIIGTAVFRFWPLSKLGFL